MLFNILTLISVLMCLTLLKRFVAIFPSLLACTIRWKESVNLEASVRLSNDRNRIAFVMIIPFCLVAYRFSLYTPTFMEGFDENIRLAILIGIFIAYILLKMILHKSFRPHRGNNRVYDTAGKASFTFMIILALILMAAGGVMTFAGVEEELIRNAMLWISIATYALLVLRKTQIFASSCSLFTAFLYLCALEILPTGILVVPAIIF